MALMKCPECGKDVSDKANACPHCGCPVPLQHISNTQNEEEDTEEYVFCPKCMSTHVHTEQKGFSGGKALAGAVAVGGIGLLAGTIGSKKVNITCLKCGHKFQAGDALIATKSEKETILKEVERLLCKGEKLNVVKYLNERLSWNTSQSFGFIDSYLRGHKELKEKYINADEPKTKKGVIIFYLWGSIILFALVSAVFLMIWSLTHNEYELKESNTSFWISYSIISILFFALAIKSAKSDIKKLEENK